MYKLLVKIILGGGFLFLLLAGILPAQGNAEWAEPAFSPAADAEFLAVSFQNPFLLFTLHDSRVASVRLWIRDGGGKPVYDSGEVDGAAAGWDSRVIAMGGPLTYELQAWDGEGNLVQWRGGEIQPGGAGESPLVAAPYDVAGNYTIGGSLGVGTTAPERAVHVKGANAVFRMDRSQNTTAFMLVRTDTAGSPLKTFLAGVDADGTDQGQFVINDLGAAVSGGGTRRMTIANTGAVTFTGTVQAAGFYTASGAISGLMAVAHDSSLSGNGTTSSLLGVANGGVTPAKISATGSSSGQVLTSNGTAAVWQTPALGITTVVHDATLNGTGVTGSPLGIAGNAVTTDKLADNSVGPSKIKSPGVTTANIYDNAVTQAKLSISGTAASGQVLGTDGASLAWQDDGLALPYSDGASTAAGADAFAIENTGSGRAIHAIADSDVAVWGVSDSGKGVMGWSTSGDGVEGKTSASGKSGVWGRSDTGIGVTGSSTSNDGVRGTTGDSGHAGVYGVNNAATGAGVIGWGTTSSNAGYLGGYDYGVKGVSTLGPGVMGETTSTHPRAAGIFGRTTSTTNPAIRAEIESDDGVALWIENTNTGSGATNTWGIQVESVGPSAEAAALNGDVVINGVLTTWGGEYKLQPHPADAGKQLAFVGLAGAEQTLYARGSGRLQAGRGVIELPDYFTLAASGDGLTVHVTPTDDCRGIFVVSRSISRVELKEAQGGASDACFDYLVMAVRRSFENHAVVQDNEAFKPNGRISVEEFELSLERPEYQSVRRLMIENGTLTPAGKLNLDVARRLGWKLGPKTRTERLGESPSKQPAAAPVSER